MGDIMEFPDTVEEFMEEYKMVDKHEIYSNGTEYVPIFRMEQWFEHCKAQSANAKRYIDADALIQLGLKDGAYEYVSVQEIAEMPTADVVEVVRCKDCIHAKQHSYAPAECQWYCTASLQYHSDRFFCACGERRTHDN